MEKFMNFNPATINPKTFNGKLKEINVDPELADLFIDYDFIKCRKPDTFFAYQISKEEILIKPYFEKQDYCNDRAYYLILNGINFDKLNVLNKEVLSMAKRKYRGYVDNPKPKMIESDNSFVFRVRNSIVVTQEEKDNTLFVTFSLRDKVLAILEVPIDNPSDAKLVSGPAKDLSWISQFILDMYNEKKESVCLKNGIQELLKML